MSLRNLLEPSDPVEREMTSDLDKVGLVSDGLMRGMIWSARTSRVAITLGVLSLACILGVGVWQRHHTWLLLSVVTIGFIVTGMTYLIQQVGHRTHNAILEALHILRHVGKVRTGLVRRQIANLPPEARPN